MHDAAWVYVSWYRTDEPLSVLEAGSRDVNGSVRGLFPHARWVGVDIAPGPGVDVVADFADYQHPEPVDLVISTEVLEHTPRWRDVVAAAARNLKPEGRFVLTAASHGRAPHSAVDGGPVGPDEHYENIDPPTLADELARWFTVVDVQVEGTDVQAMAVL